MRRLLVLVLSILLLLSCQTRDGYDYSPEERAWALVLLAEDSMSYVMAELSLNGDAFIDALPETYRAYEDYVPQYKDIEEQYTNKLAELLKPLLPEVFPIIQEAAAGICRDAPVEAFRDDSGLTSLVWDECGQAVAGYYLERLDELEIALWEAYSDSYREFSLVRDAYANLSRVGYSVYITEPGMAGTEELAEAMADSLMYQLADAESILKNRPPESPDSPYRIFWSYN